jgi:uncharacterized coiled-coil protein SlyX
MSHSEEINKELDKIHADHQLRKITSNIAERLDSQDGVMEEFNNRLADLEESIKKSNEKAKHLT